MDNWKSSLLSSGGEADLVNSCLSSLPIYTTGFYRLSEDVHRKMDSIRSRFFWRGASDSFKYHMVRWGVVCRLKDFGGLGVIDTWLMNDCLLCKWFWRMNLVTNELLFRILKAKYFPRGGVRDIKTLRGSRF